MPASGVETIQLRLLQIEQGFRQKAEVAMAEVVAALEGWAKSEHSYTDRTANTTNSIKGEVAEATALIVRGVLSAGMEYDVFLELAHDGKWAFLWPVIERHKDDILAIIEARMKL